ncbi:hypothetical protein V6N13_109341 [Hibiscus sabdariffa]
MAGHMVVGTVVKCVSPLGIWSSSMLVLHQWRNASCTVVTRCTSTATASSSTPFSTMIITGASPLVS